MNNTLERREVSNIDKKNREELTKDLVELVPATDIYETDSAVNIIVDMPGVNENSLDVTYENGELHLTGWQSVDRKIDKYELLRKEFDFGVFKRTFRIGDGLDTNNINAKIKDGVLTIKLPKSERLKAKKIKIDFE